MMRECAAELGVLKAVGEYFDGVRQKSGEDEEAYLQRTEELADRAINSVRMLKTLLYQFDVRMEGGYEKWKETQSVFNRAIREEQRKLDGILTRPGYDHRNRDQHYHHWRQSGATSTTTTNHSTISTNSITSHSILDPSQRRRGRRGRRRRRATINTPTNRGSRPDYERQREWRR